MSYVFLWATNELESSEPLEQVPLDASCGIVLPVTQIASGAADAVLILAGGKVYSLGKNRYGQLGHGHSEPVRIPALISCLQDIRIQKVACGRYHTVFLTEEGRIYTCGRNEEKQLGNEVVGIAQTPTVIPQELLPATIKDVSVGALHTIAITDKGEVYTFGDGSYGQLGHGQFNCCLPAKVEIENLMAIQAAAGSFHSMILTASGEVYTFGDNTFGQLGRGNCEQISMVPQKVQALQYADIARISAGGIASGFVTENGYLYTCGDNGFGQIGHGDTAEVRIPTLVLELIKMGILVKQVSFGLCFSMLLSESGQVFTFGVHYGRHVESSPQLISLLSHLPAVAIDCYLDSGVVLLERNKFEDEMVALLYARY